MARLVTDVDRHVAMMSAMAPTDTVRATWLVPVPGAKKKDFNVGLFGGVKGQVFATLSQGR